MGKLTHHQPSYVVKEFLCQKDIKTIVTLLAVELGMLLLATYKGLGYYYLPVIILLMVFSTAGCAIAFHFEADRYLLIIVLVLMNVGFLVQQIHSGKNMQVKSFVVKFAVAIAVSMITAFFYKYFGDLLSRDFMVFVCMALQYILCIATMILGRVIGDSSEQGATISLFGITPFELVKVIYIFVAVGILCKEEKEVFFLGRRKIKREWILVIHTVFLSIFFLICRELGTLMIVYITGLILLWTYGKNRKCIIGLILLSIAGYLIAMYVCQQIVYPLLASNEITLPGVVSKLVKRFGTAFHPETAISGDGYQGTLGLEAIAIGGWLGISSERYRLPLPEASNDFVFANVVQTCGLMMGLLIILFLFTLLKRGIEISERCEDLYFQGISFSITVLIIVESIIHLGYNTAVMPITGIPLYFISQGFTAIITGMALTAVLLVISTGNIERTVV